jgi:uncharacterized protein (DUF1499 family)
MINNRSRISWLAFAGFTLAVVSALTALTAAVGYRLGAIPLRLALTTLLRWGAYGGVAAAGVSLLALGVAVVRRRASQTELAAGVMGLVLALAIVAVPARFRFGPPTAPIHDITTDTEDPPQFVAVVPLNTPDRTVYEGDRIAALQRQTYPDLQPFILSRPPAEAFEVALATAEDMGWDLVEADPATGRIEATDTTFWFGFKDDVVIRVRPDARGSRVDLRSLSRVGGGDAGTNARRIRAYLSALADRAD